MPEDGARMSDGPVAPGGRTRAGDPLEPLDPDLTIFALANGMDLARERAGVPCRVLEWFREGLERTIGIEAEAGGEVMVWVGARRGRRSEPGEARRELRRSAGVDELRRSLRPLLAEAVEAANALEERDLS